MPARGGACGCVRGTAARAVLGARDEDDGAARAVEHAARDAAGVDRAGRPVGARAEHERVRRAEARGACRPDRRRMDSLCTPGRRSPPRGSDNAAAPLRRARGGGRCRGSAAPSGVVAVPRELVCHRPRASSGEREHHHDAQRDARRARQRGRRRQRRAPSGDGSTATATAASAPRRQPRGAIASGHGAPSSSAPACPAARARGRRAAIRARPARALRGEHGVQAGRWRGRLDAAQFPAVAAQAALQRG